MIGKKITVSETIGIPRSGEFVRVGVPFGKGELSGTGDLSLLSSGDLAHPVQVTALKRWKDGSVKWALVDFAATVSAWGEAAYLLATPCEGSKKAVPGIHISSGADAWQVDTGAAVFSIDAREFKPFDCTTKVDGKSLTAEGRCSLLTAEDQRPVPRVESITVESEGALRSVLVVRGNFPGSAQLVSRLHFFAGSSLVRLDFTVHNPQPARHPGGLWDLGDPGSLFFQELALQFSLPEAAASEILCYPEPGCAPVRTLAAGENLTLYQESSGGENWLSPVHRTKDGKVPFTLRGYQLRLGEKQVHVGERATPVTWLGSAGVGLAAVLPRFWQEFPKAMEASSGNLKISLFPGNFPALHELQGGEQKTHTVYLDFAARPEGLAWARAPLTAVASPEVIQLSGVVADLPTAPIGADGAQSLVEEFIGGPEAFQRKREAADEYGWRNFGELHADHEAVNHQGPVPFVSHYNNQYDPCAGMYRMSLATGKPLWGELASDLARHIIDIDLYRTSLDREEYNHGLFWHTDHYLSAGLATHRSFSRKQVGKRDPRYCGGGPGAEHCYTTGLMLHYFLTGEPEARDAVLGLADWCHRSLCGSPTLLAALKKTRYYLSLLRAADRGTPAIFPRFPLSRGTGNAISACIDAYEVSDDGKYLDRAEELMRGALHPDDDLEARDLLNAEDCWSYTVLLVALAKYLGKLDELKAYGDGYSYARACLLAYASWMGQHEYPYLDKPEILEYPNETWPAQDLRKSVIFYQAARYAEPEQRKAFISRGLFFYAAAREQLGLHATSAFTRPVALMLQNGWVGPRLEAELACGPAVTPCGASFGTPIPYLCSQAVAARIAGDFARAFRETSLQRELAWLSARL